MSKEYSVDDYKADINHIVGKLVGRTPSMQAEEAARERLQRVVDFEPIYGAAVQILLVGQNTRPTYADVEGV